MVIAVGDSHDQVRDGLAKRAAAIRVGDGTEDGITMGPVISAAHKERVLGYVVKGVAEGAELEHDGRQVDAPDAGYFVAPCLFDNVVPDTIVTREQIFGPVLCITTVARLEDALKVSADHDEPEVASVSSVWHGAHLQEREIYDLLGVRFSGHPNLKRMLLWEGLSRNPCRSPGR